MGSHRREGSGDDGHMHILSEKRLGGISCYEDKGNTQKGEVFKEQEFHFTIIM